MHLFQILTHYECITYTYYTTTTYNIIIPNQSTFCYCPLIYWLKYLESPRITRVLLCRFSLSPKDWKDLHTNRLLLFSLKQEVKGDNNSIGKKYVLSSSIHRSYAYSRIHILAQKMSVFGHEITRLLKNKTFSDMQWQDYLLVGKTLKPYY